MTIRQKAGSAKSTYKGARVRWGKHRGPKSARTLRRAAKRRNEQVAEPLRTIINQFSDGVPPWK